MKPGDRVRVSALYGERWHALDAPRYVGEEGTVVALLTEGGYIGYVKVQLDCDERPGLFRPGEIEPVESDPYARCWIAEAPLGVWSSGPMVVWDWDTGDLPNAPDGWTLRGPYVLENAGESLDRGTPNV